MPVYSLEGITPVVHPAAFVHETAVLIGDVIIAADCYIGPNASLRGDFGRIIVERGANVQDTCVMHSFPGKDCIVESDEEGIKRVSATSFYQHHVQCRLSLFLGCYGILGSTFEVRDACGAQIVFSAMLESGVPFAGSFEDLWHILASSRGCSITYRLVT